MTTEQLHTGIGLREDIQELMQLHSHCCFMIKQQECFCAGGKPIPYPISKVLLENAMSLLAAEVARKEEEFKNL